MNHLTILVINYLLYLKKKKAYSQQVFKTSSIPLSVPYTHLYCTSLIGHSFLKLLRYENKLSPVNQSMGYLQVQDRN